MKDPNIVDEFFKRRLQQAEEELPSSSWQAIKDKLPAKSTGWNGQNSALSKKNIFGWVLLFLVFGSTFWYVIDLRNKNADLKNKLDERSSTLAQFNIADTKISKNVESEIGVESSNTNFNSKHQFYLKNESEANKSSNPKYSVSLSKRDKYIDRKGYKSIAIIEKVDYERSLIKNEDLPMTLRKNTGRKSIFNSKNQLAIAKHKVHRGVKNSSATLIEIDEQYFTAIDHSEKTNLHGLSTVGSKKISAHSAASKVNEDKNNLENEEKISPNIGENNNYTNRTSYITDSMPSTQTSLLSIATATNMTSATFNKDTRSDADSLLANDNRNEQTIVKEQKKGASVSSRSAISFEYFIAPDLAYSSVSYSGAPLSKAAQEYKKNDKNRVGFSTGLLLNFNLYKRFYIQTGLMYTNAGDKNNSNYQWRKTDTTLVGYNVSSTKNDPNQITTLSDSAVKFKYMMPSNSVLISSTTQQDSLNQNKITSYQTYSNNINSNDILVYNIKVNEYVNILNQQARNSISYFGIPLVLGTQQVLSKRFSVGVFSGIITNILVSPRKIKAYSYLESEYSEKIIEKEIALNKLNFVYWGGVDICYNLSPQWSIRVAPVVKHALNSLYKDEVILRQVPYSYGIQLGVKYFFVDHK